MIASTRARRLCAATLGLSLCACSSGGDDGPAVPATPTITPANAQDVASVAASLGSLLDLNGEALALIQGAPQPAFLGGGPTVMDCTDGGTQTVEFVDAAPIDELSAGDSFTVTFADCSEGGDTLNGSVGLSIDTFQATETTFDLGVTLSVNNLSAQYMDMGTGTTETFTQNGMLGETMTITKSGDFGYGVTGAFDTSYSEGGTTLSWSLSDLNTSFQYMSAEGVAMASFNANYVTNLAQGNYSVSTPSPLVLLDSDGGSPSMGQVVITAGGDTLYLTAQPADPSMVLLELDQATDGTIDWSDLVLWDDL